MRRLPACCRPQRDTEPMIDLKISDGVAFITLNAPATRNALNNEIAEQLVVACDVVDRDPAGHVRLTRKSLAAQR